MFSRRKPVACSRLRSGILCAPGSSIEYAAGPILWMGPAVLYVAVSHQCRTAEKRCASLSVVPIRNDACYRWETIVPSITARPFDRGAAGRAERTGASVEASAASARTGFHTVREPPERASDLEELSHGRWPRRIGMT